MSKTSETKDRILKMLESGDKRLIDICPELGLTAATVSQHLKELRQMRLIEEAPDQHFRNMKYYRLSRTQAISQSVIRGNIPRYFIGVIAIAAVASGLLLFAALSGQLFQKQGSGLLNILLTDPPHVPSGTQSLNITYSGIQLHVINRSVNDWISINATGSADLMSLVNVSKLIASAQIPTNAIINAATFNITGATITIDNQTYQVYLQDPKISTSVYDNLAFNGSSSLLLDLSPTVIPWSVNGTSVFEMLPSVSAAMMGRHEMPAIRAGPQNEPLMLNRAAIYSINMSRGNINITSVSKALSGNTTTISITVKDDSSKNVTIEHVLLMPAMPRNATGVNGTPWRQPDRTGWAIPDMQRSGHSRPALPPNTNNSSNAAHAANGAGNAHEAWLARPLQYPVILTIEGNGTLVQSGMYGQFGSVSQSQAQGGITIHSGASAQLEFSGELPSSYTNYTITVLGSDGAFALYPSMQSGNYWNAR